MKYHIEMTITNLFLVPPLGIGRDRLRIQNLVDAYIQDAGNINPYTDVVYLLFKPDNLSIFNEFVEEERYRTDRLIDEYDYSGGYVVLVYKIIEEDREDVKKIFRGEYSKISERYKSKIPPTIKKLIQGEYKEDISLQYEIIGKSQRLKEYWEELLGQEIDSKTEVWSKPDKDRETLFINKVKEAYAIPT